MTIKPLAGKYLCQVIEDAKLLASGIYIAESAKETPHRAMVLEAGKNRVTSKGKTLKQSAKVGDIVHFQRVWNRGLPSAKDLIFIKEEEIVGVEKITC